jgi:hypothetical protein
MVRMTWQELSARTVARGLLHWGQGKVLVVRIHTCGSISLSRGPGPKLDASVCTRKRLPIDLSQLDPTAADSMHQSEVPGRHPVSGVARSS